MRDNAEQDTDDPRDIGEVANELFLLHMAQYMYWKDPTEGAVSPALSTFFSFCNPEVPALVHWARWLRIDHEADDGIDILSLPLAEELVEAMIAKAVTDPTIADAMRRAVRGEGIGERDPNQLELF